MEKGRKTLFRDQVVKRQSAALLGRVLIVPSLSYSLLALLLLLLVITVLLFLFSNTYSRKVTVYGSLKPDAGLIKVFSNSPGTLKTIHVNEGEVVEPGQPLFTINGSHLLEDGRDIYAELIDEYQTQLNIVVQSKQRLPKEYEQSLQTMKAQKQFVISELAMLTEQQNILDLQAELTQKQIANLASLSEASFVTSNEIDSLETKRLSQLSLKQDLALSVNSRKQEISTQEYQINNLRFEQEKKLDALNNQESDLRQLVIRAQASMSQTVVATTVGEVGTIQVREGQEVFTSKPLTTIIPAASTLQAEMLVPASAIGFISEGQTVNIRYAAFSYQKFGIQTATVTEISNTIFTQNELLDVSLPISEPVYIVIAELMSDTILAYGRDIDLKVGLSFEADIELEQRTLLEWLFDPLYTLVGRS